MPGAHLEMLKPMPTPRGCTTEPLAFVFVFCVLALLYSYGHSADFKWLYLQNKVQLFRNFTSIYTQKKGKIQEVLWCNLLELAWNGSTVYSHSNSSTSSKGGFY